MAGVSETRPEPELKKAEQAQQRGCRGGVITSPQEAGYGAEMKILPHRASLGQRSLGSCSLQQICLGSRKDLEQRSTLKQRS